MTLGLWTSTPTNRTITMKTDRPVANATFGHHRVPRHYFVTPRQSGLPREYFRTWRDNVDPHDVVAVLCVVMFVVALVVAG